MKTLSAFVLAVLLPPFAYSEIPADEHFHVETVVDGLVDAMEIAPDPYGRVFIVERTGAVKLFDPEAGSVETLALLDVALRDDGFARESGLLGVTLDPDFARNSWIYLFYSDKDDPFQRLSRFEATDTALYNEVVILEFAHDRENHVCHEGGSLAFGPDGNLYLSTGDNTCPFKSSGYAPIDEMPDRYWYDAQRSAGNTNDLRGKILRIKPLAEGGYAIPSGNLFSPNQPKTRPEIYAMGCRNPFRISIDSRSGHVFWGEVGPDAGVDSERGSRGFDEINRATGPGNFGWPYFVADNKAYADYDFASQQTKATFVAQRPKNDSPNSTGLGQLPPATEPLWFYPRASACAGPVYYHDDFPESKTKLPKTMDGRLLVYDWTSAWMRALLVDEDGNLIANDPWLSKHFFVHPVDMEMGIGGDVWLLEYGSSWYDGNDGKLKRISYSEEPLILEIPESDPRMTGLDPAHPGTSLIAQTTCLACHMTKQKSIGPTYLDVAQKYKSVTGAREQLAEKILTGGAGVWGEAPMPPHAQHNIEETLQMVDAILEMAR
tara:strand:+ start:629 stop:2272 length:1644 start_codon:yes stop_codon:yes gene_type:complete